MAKNKTTENSSSVLNFINEIENEEKRKDCMALIDLMRKQTGLDPKMWGPSIVGFGSHHYKYESGREGDSPNIAFSPRVKSIALYLSGSLKNRETLLGKFGKHKTEKGCIHINRLADIDQKVLLTLVENHIEYMTGLYPSL